MTSAVPTWLPERHLGVIATLAHADELIAQIGELLFSYLRGEDVIRIREVPNGAMSDAVVERLAPIPRKLPLLVADAFVTLRAALEHTLFAEAEFLNGEPLSEDAARSIEMPASLKHNDYVEWVKKRKRKTPDSLAAGSELLRRVEGLQPFHRNIRPDLHPLARLALHTNRSKHRTPATIAVRLVTIVRDDEVVRSINDVELRPELPLHVGEVIAQTPLGQRVPADLWPALGINRPDTDEWPIMMHELDEISSWVRQQAIPRLITGGGASAEELPTHYEISTGHDDESLAIARGSTLTAAQRNKNQMGAAVVRSNLVDLLLPQATGLTIEGITAWLAQVEDVDVIDMITQLKASLSQEPGGTEAAEMLLNELGNRALQFMSDQPQ
ncbi:hypothetical protein JOF28_000291 [Leucobacter exalbidus]|uniref:Uncharacterized protein n=1 Tax=Leucobacter exalbidus TaxID=662960 RepID=A0A940PTN3_9MICO|nr:hypothetical protein [Leucobacter exalbidus]MBP1325059.1 hypothetical protein [Leucobacter exalbidus]